MVTIAPIEDKVFVRLDPKPEMSGRIYLPYSAREKACVLNTGVVAFVGPGKMLDDGSRTPISLKPGDHVLMHQYPGRAARWGPAADETAIVAHAEDILGIVEA